MSTRILNAMTFVSQGYDCAVYPYYTPATNCASKGNGPAAVNQIDAGLDDTYIHHFYWADHWGKFMFSMEKFVEDYYISDVTAWGLFNGASTGKIKFGCQVEYLGTYYSYYDATYRAAPIKTWEWQSESYSVNPLTGQPWTRYELNNARFGGELWNTGGAFSPRCDRFYIVVTYTAVAGDRAWTLIQEDRRGRPIFLAECKAIVRATGEVVETGWTNNGIYRFTQLPTDQVIDVEVRWGFGPGAQFRKYYNVYEAAGDDIVALVTNSHTQNTDATVNGVEVTTEPASPSVGNSYVSSDDGKMRIYV